LVKKQPIANPKLLLIARISDIKVETIPVNHKKKREIGHNDLSPEFAALEQ
jgi:hypothetical protein